MNTDHILSPAIIDRLLPTPELSIAEIEARYPARRLPKGAEVMRVGPSPTGFLHLGTLYAALICKTMAQKTGGVFYLRMEDTDRKREVPGSRELIMELLDTFNLSYDEGPIIGGDKGDYGPYTQSQRGDIYKAYVRRMLELGRAYPCFVTPEEQEQILAKQTAAKVRPGYYGQWATWRDKSEADVTAALDAGKPFVIRFRSLGDGAKKRTVADRIKGQKELPENDNDVVILKGDGLPTYHMAHVVDDHLMHTTTVLRADEWFPSVTLHMQLAEAIDVAPFTYAHISPIQKMDGSSRRKLSKRKDPEANVQLYEQQGYPVVAVIEYMLNLANSNFEDWRRDNPELGYAEFPFAIEKMQKNAGALLNLQKLDDISRDHLAALSTTTLFEQATAWAGKFDQPLQVALVADQAYSEKVFSIERVGGKRKDITKFSDIRPAYGYFFDDVYANMANFDFATVQKTDVQAICSAFLNSYNPKDDQDAWFTKLKQLGDKLGFTPDTREFRKNPTAFKGSVAEVAMVLRVALTGQNRSPNLYDVIRVMGQDRVVARLKKHAA